MCTNEFISWGDVQMSLIVCPLLILGCFVLSLKDSLTLLWSICGRAFLSFVVLLVGILRRSSTAYPATSMMWVISRCFLATFNSLFSIFGFGSRWGRPR